jgi:hypothetical protein
MLTGRNKRIRHVVEIKTVLINHSLLAGWHEVLTMITPHGWMLPVLILGNIAMGFMIGKLHERLAWNDKICSGHILPPQKR